MTPPPRPPKDKRGVWRRKEDADNAEAAAKVPTLEIRVIALEKNVDALGTKLDNYPAINTTKINSLTTVNGEQLEILQRLVSVRRAVMWMAGILTPLAAAAAIYKAFA